MSRNTDMRVTSNLKSLVGCSRHHLQRAEAAQLVDNNFRRHRLRDILEINCQRTSIYHRICYWRSLMYCIKARRAKTSHCWHFLPRDAMHKCGLCCCRPPSASVRLSRSCIVSYCPVHISTSVYLHSAVTVPVRCYAVKC